MIEFIAFLLMEFFKKSYRVVKKNRTISKLAKTISNLYEETLCIADVRFKFESFNLC